MGRGTTKMVVLQGEDASAAKPTAPPSIFLALPSRNGENRYMKANRPRERVNVNVNNWGRYRNVLLRILHEPFHVA